MYASPKESNPAPISLLPSLPTLTPQKKPLSKAFQAFSQIFILVN